MRTLLVEGWRTSSHSYALVNQYQLLHLRNDPRFSLLHRDVPFYRPEWSVLDGGLPAEEQALIAQIPAPEPDTRADVIYRISFPFRVHEGAGRVFVFVTSEIPERLSGRMVGPDGRADSVHREAVEIVTTSQWSRQGLLLSGFAEERVHVIPHGVDPALGEPLPPELRRRVRAGLGIEDDQFAFLNISAMTWNKGIGPMLAAFAIHLHSNPRAVLVLKGADSLYGAGLIKNGIEEAIALCPPAADTRWLQSIRYLGNNLSRADLARLLRSCDAYLSLYRAEGFNLPALEAMAAGLPLLVTEGGSTDDFCPAGLGLKIAARRTTGAPGTYLEPDLESAVQHMNRIAVDSSLRACLSRDARTWTAGRYRWDQVTRMLADLLYADASRG